MRKITPLNNGLQIPTNSLLISSLTLRCPITSIVINDSIIAMSPQTSQHKLQGIRHIRRITMRIYNGNARFTGSIFEPENWHT